MRKQKAYIVLSILSAAILALSGCGAAAGGEVASGSVSAGNAAQQTQLNDAVYVQVQSIEGDTVTALIGTMTESTGQPENAQGKQDGAQQGAPQMPAGDGTQSGAPPEQPANERGSDQQNTRQSPDNGAMSGGQTPQGRQGGRLAFTAGDAVLLFQVSESTIVTRQNGPKTTEAALSDLAAGDILALTLSGDNTAETIVILSMNDSFDPSQAGGQPGAGFGGSDTVTNGTAASTIDTDTSVSAETYASDGDDENALRIDGATVSLSGITVSKTGGASSNTENGDFYGMNAGLLALNGATATITGANITTSAVNGNGVFSYGAGTTVNISDSVIRTAMNNSGGIQTTGGATMNASNLDVETQGNSSAAIRSDRGGGDVNVTGGNYVTNGTGSPAIYSTADISVDDATLTANASEAVVVEGKNTVTLQNVILTGNMQAGMDANENVHNIMLYQSMSGDAEEGQSSFSATGGSITAHAGDMFYVTNTTCSISLSNVALTLFNDTLLNVAGNSSARGWGTAGANGGTCIFTASNQTLKGNILVDSISSLDFRLADGSVFTGVINSAQAGSVSVTLGSGCQWVLTGDSYLASFTGDVSQIVNGGFTVFVNGTAITA